MKGFHRFKGLLSGLFLLCSAAAQASGYDFSATNSWTSYNDETQSVTLYYKILTDAAGDSVEVVLGDDAYSNGTIVIPDSVKYTLNEVETTYFVESIDASAFAENTALKEVTIPKYVTVIGDGAFNGCENLETVVFNAEKCGRAFNIFSGCNAISSLTFGETVMAVPDNLMSKVSLDTDYYIDGSKDNGAIEVTDFPNLETLVIPDNVIYIGQYAFAMNNGLKTLTIGTGVLYLCRDAFADCPNLATVNYNAVSCSSEGYHGNAMDYCAFWNDTKLSSFNIADGVQSIPDYLLYGEYSSGFPNLTALTIPSSVTSIGEKAFSNCTSLAALTLDDGTETLAITTSSSATAFSNCPIETLYLGRNLSYTNSASTVATNEGYSPFRGMTTITSLTIGENVTAIGREAFYGCTGLTSLTIPAGITSLAGQCFWGCTSLTTIQYNAKDCSSSGWMNADGTAWSNIFFNAPLQHFYFGDTVETIPKYLVNGQYSQYANLTEVTIPASVTTIETHAFNYTDIKTVYCLGSTPATCSSDSFSDTRVTDTWLVVPEGAAINYGDVADATKATATGWNVLDHMREATVTIRITAADGYATRYSGYSYTLDNDLTAYSSLTVGSYDEETNTYSLTLGGNYNGGATVNGNTALIVYGNQNSNGYVCETISSTTTSATPSGSAVLLGSASDTTTTGPDGETTEGYKFYMLSYGKSAANANVIGFYYGNADGAAFTSEAHKAWLAVTQAAAAKIAGFSFGDIVIDSEEEQNAGFDDEEDVNIDVDESETTGINNLPADIHEKVVYNMAGQRVSGMAHKGIYIVGGRKVIKK